MIEFQHIRGCTKDEQHSAKDVDGSLRRDGPNKHGSNVVNGLSLAAAASPTEALAELAEALSDNMTRFIDLFRARWMRMPATLA